MEHLLLALLAEHDPTLDAQFSALGVAPADIATALRRHVGTGDDRLWDGILVTPRVRAVVRLAEGLAGERLVEPVHVFEAIRAEGKSAAADILLDALRNAPVQPRVRS